MNSNRLKLALAATACIAAAGCATLFGPTNTMTFFVTSVGRGNGADLGGLAGADRHCQQLAEAVDAGGNRVWRAYLSTTPAGGVAGVNARDRIGTGPWQNAKSVVIAQNLSELHGNNRLTKETALTEIGQTINGRGDKPNMHAILTGSSADGRAVPGTADTTCSNWTSSGAGSAIVGHHDRIGLNDSAEARSWNASHATKGCSQDALRSTGGAGLLYCFAAN